MVPVAMEPKTANRKYGEIILKARHGKSELVVCPCSRCYGISGYHTTTCSISPYVAEYDPEGTP